MESVQKEGGDGRGRTVGRSDVIILARLSSLAVFFSLLLHEGRGVLSKNVPKTSLVLGPLLRFCHMSAEQYSNDESLFYDTRILNLDFDTKLRISVDGQAHNCPLPSHSLSS